MFKLLPYLAAQCLKKPARIMANFIRFSLFDHKVFSSLSFFSSSIEMENWGDTLIPSTGMPPIITNLARFSVHCLKLFFYFFLNFNRITFAHKSIQFDNHYSPHTDHFPIPFQHLVRRIEHHRQALL